MPDVVNSPEPTDARFSLRGLLIAMAVVAGIAMLVGPIVRGFSRDKQLRLLVLVRGGKRYVMRVPEEKREAVTTVLKERIATE